MKAHPQRICVKCGRFVAEVCRRCSLGEYRKPRAAVETMSPEVEALREKIVRAREERERRLNEAFERQVTQKRLEEFGLGEGDGR